MITTVYIIRHGQTLGAEDKRYTGHLDVALSPEGENQMHRLASYLLIQAINETPAPSHTTDLLDAVYCSDLKRARKSAEIIAAAFGLKPITVPDFKERGFGRWEGMAIDEILQTYPAEFDAWSKDPLNFSMTGGESAKTVQARVIPAFNEIVSDKKGKRIAIVAHGGVNRIILCELLAIPFQNLFRIEQDFGALNICVFYDDFPVVKRMNYVINGGRS